MNACAKNKKAKVAVLIWAKWTEREELAPAIKREFHSYKQGQFKKQMWQS